MSGAIRPCERCRNGDEVCQVGNFWLCTNCDRPRPTAPEREYYGKINPFTQFTYPRPVGGPYDVDLWKRGGCPVCGSPGREGLVYACRRCYTPHDRALWFLDKYITP